MRATRNPVALATTMLLMAGCGQTILPGDDVEFTLAVGQVARLPDQDMSVEFVSVPQDSRCPEDAVCVWQGDGAIALRVRQGSRQLDTTLHTALDPQSMSRDGVTLRVIGLSPARRTGRQIEPGDYRVRLRATGG